MNATVRQTTEANYDVLLATKVIGQIHKICAGAYVPSIDGVQIGTTICTRRREAVQSIVLASAVSA